MADNLLTLEQMAERHRCTPKTFSRNVRRLGIPHLQIGRAMRFNARTVEEFLDPRNVLLRSRPIPRYNHDGGSVYLLQADYSHFYKIGYSKHGIEARVKQLQCGCPYPLILHATRPGEPITERRLHGYFSKYSIKGRNEWFDIQGAHWSEVVYAFLAWEWGVSEDEWRS